MTQITTMITITHLEPDILECKVKWALGSIIMNKASEGNRIPLELVQIFSLAPKSLQMMTAAMKLKDACSLEEKL